MKSSELLEQTELDYLKYKHCLKNNLTLGVYSYKWNFMGSLLYINLDEKGLFFIDYAKCINFKLHLPDYNLDKLNIQFGFVNQPSEYKLMLTTYGMENAFKILKHILEIESEIEKDNNTYAIF
jgi:hypothetical protein